MSMIDIIDKIQKIVIRVTLFIISIWLLIILFIGIKVSPGPFWTPHDGVWVCEELGITLDFGDREGLDGAAITVRGRITIDGKEDEIVLLASLGGECSFIPIEEMGKSLRERKIIFRGRLSRRMGSNKMYFSIYDAAYEFVKQD